MKTVTVLDFETTGLSNIRGDRIIEIGAVKLFEDNIIGVFQTLVNPERNIPKMSTQITGITEEMIKNAPTYKEVFPDFVDFIGNDVLVIHNVKFDSVFLESALTSLGINKKFQYYCTLQQSRRSSKLKQARINRKLHDFKLSTLKDYFNLTSLWEMHRALADTFVTAQLYLKLENKSNFDSSFKLEKQIKKLLEAKKAEKMQILSEKIL